MPKRRSNKAIREEIAELKEERSRTLLKYAPEDDIAAAADHPEVRDLEERIRELRDEMLKYADDDE